MCLTSLLPLIGLSGCSFEQDTLSFFRILKNVFSGAPGWLSWLSLISAQV